MTTIQHLKNLIDIELGSTGWTIIRERSGGATLRTARGEVGFDTLKAVVELVPALLREIERGKEDAYEQALRDWGHRDDE